MALGDVTMLNGTSPGHPPSRDQKEGAYYYVQGGAVSVYKKAIAQVTFPNNYRLRYNSDWGRNAYISLGVDGGSGGPIDIGFRNMSRWGESEDNAGDEALTEKGHGWEAYCYQCKVGSLPEYLHPTIKAPSGTTGAKCEVTPLTQYAIEMKVEWLNGSKVIGSVTKTFNLTRAYNWTVFYRFASLPTTNPNASIGDGTFMLGGTFETAHLVRKSNNTNVNWGIDSSPVTSAWIVNAPKCSIPYKWDVGEQFRIDHWAV